MKHIFFLMAFCVCCLKGLAQSGTITHHFYMTKKDATVDTCELSMSITNGKATSVVFAINHTDKKSYNLGFISGNPNMYHKYKYTETRINDFRNLLITLKAKFVQWSVTAKENNITSFEKKIDHFENVPIFSVGAVTDGVRYYQGSEPPYVKSCTPIFYVNSEEKGVYWGWTVTLERTTGYNQGFWTSYPIKEEKKFKMYLQFTTESQFDSLIDALDVEKTKKMLNDNAESKKDIDSLFK